MKLTQEILKDAVKYYLNGNSLEETTRTICSKYSIKFCRETLRRLLQKMKIKRNEIKVKVSKNFRITVPLKEIRKIGATSYDYIKVVIEKDSKVAEIYIRIPEKPKSRKAVQVKKELPLSIRERLSIKEGDTVTIKEVIKIEKPKNCKVVENNILDLTALVPSYMMCESFTKNGKEYLRLWYEKGNGRTKQIELKRFILIDKKVGEFFGLLQAEGGKKSDKISFTNSIINEHKIIVKVAELYFGIPKDKWKVCLYYNPNLISKEKAKQMSEDFVNEVSIPNAKIGLVEHYGLTKTNFQIYISSQIFNRIFNNVLKFLRKFAVKYNLTEFCKGFIIKTILGDGTAMVTKDLTHLDITISEIDRDAQKDLINMLKLFSINSSVYKNRIDISTDFNSCIWFLENNLFEGHEENRRKFLTYVINNYYFSLLYKRLKTLNGITKIKEFAEKNGLKEKTAKMYLARNFRRGFIKRVKRGCYEISTMGKKFITLYESALSELSTFHHTQRS